MIRLIESPVILDASGKYHTIKSLKFETDPKNKYLLVFQLSAFNLCLKYIGVRNNFYFHLVPPHPLPRTYRTFSKFMFNLYTPNPSDSQNNQSTEQRIDSLCRPGSLPTPTTSTLHVKQQSRTEQNDDVGDIIAITASGNNTVSANLVVRTADKKEQE